MTKPIQVGDKVRKEGRKRPNTVIVYLDIPVDQYGWVDAEKYRPHPYDLVKLLLSDGKELNGWWADTEWDGYHLKPHEIVIKWKRVQVEQFTGCVGLLSK